MSTRSRSGGKGRFSSRSRVRSLKPTPGRPTLAGAGLPVFMFGIFMVLNPDYMSLLFTETAGRLILVTAIGLEVLGYLVIKKIMAIEI